MSETNPNADRAATVERLSERQSGADAHQIIDRVIASDPQAVDGDRMAKARTWMLIALG